MENVTCIFDLWKCEVHTLEKSIVLQIPYYKIISSLDIFVNLYVRK